MRQLNVPWDDMMTNLSESFAVEMRNIVKTFPGVRALDDVSFQVRTGEIHALVGKNGAGKSTLMQILTGLYPQDSGEVFVAGQRVERMTTARAKEVGIALVAQHAKFVPGLSVAENIFTGALPRTTTGFVDWRRLNREAHTRLRQFGLEIDVRRTMESLTVAERQLIEIARALFSAASVIILDEPTAPLPKHDVQLLFSFVRAQQERGASFIYISHYLEEVFEIADRVTILRNGQRVEVMPITEVTQAKLVNLISGVDVDRYCRQSSGQQANPVLQIERLSRIGVYEDISLALHAGEIVGLTGLEGSGNGALAQALFGLASLGEGSVRLNDRPYAPVNPQEALRAGVAYLPRDRHGLGLVGMRSVRDNVSMSIIHQLVNKVGFIRRRQERSLVEGYIAALGIKTPGMNQVVENLSGGNQQKAVVAKLVATRPQILILDEPTQGVDVQAKVEILRIIDELTRDGVAVAIVSDELAELTNMCDRILVFYRGRIVREFRKGIDEMTPPEVLAAIEGEAEEGADAVA